MEKNADTTFIPGDYQHVALTSGSHLQRGWHRSRLQMLHSILNFQKDDCVADMGCGSGLSVELVAPHVNRVYGVDSNAEAVKFCRERFTKFNNVEVVKGTLNETNLRKTSLTKIICTEVLEHVYDSQIPGILHHWKELLKPGGEIFVTTPNDRSIWPVLEWCIDKFELAPKLAGDQHVSHWTRGKICNALKEAGFSHIRSGSFNLITPIAYIARQNSLGSRLSRWEGKLLKDGGPLLWATARLG